MSVNVAYMTSLSSSKPYKCSFLFRLQHFLSQQKLSQQIARAEVACS